MSNEFIEVVVTEDMQRARSNEWYGTPYYSDQEAVRQNGITIRHKADETSLAKSLFTSFYDKFKADGFTLENLLGNFLPDFFEEIAETWGENISASQSHVSKINSSTPILEIYSGTKLFVVSSDGNVFTAKLDHEFTGAIVWDGDELHSKEFREIYIDAKLFGVSENIKRMHAQDNKLTALKLEQTACEIVSLICQ